MSPQSSRTVAEPRASVVGASVPSASRIAGRSARQHRPKTNVEGVSPRAWGVETRIGLDHDGQIASGRVLDDRHVGQVMAEELGAGIPTSFPDMDVDCCRMGFQHQVPGTLAGNPNKMEVFATPIVVGEA